jgi:hypothetical protein
MTDNSKAKLPHLTSAPTAEELLRRVLDELPVTQWLARDARQLVSDIKDFLANQSGDRFEEQV